MDQDRLLRALGVLTSIGAYLMLLMGAIVTKTGSGKGCGNSWPFCHGQLIPESLPIETVFEYSHRILSALDGGLILVLTIWSWYRYRSHRKVKILGFLSLFFVVLQGGLGALTVVFEGVFIKNLMLALHFGFSLISFASVILLTIHLFQLKDQKRDAKLVHAKISPGLRYAIWGLAGYTYLVVYTGALVRHSHATMSCGYSFPLCGEQIWPSFTNPAGIHLLHRIAGMSLWLLVLLLLIWVLYTFPMRRDLRRGLIGAFVLISLQAISGVITVWMGGQVMVALIHTTLISIFFAVLCYLCMQIGFPGAKVKQEMVFNNPD